MNKSGRILISNKVRQTFCLSNKKVELILINNGIYIYPIKSEKKTTGKLKTINYQGRITIPSDFRTQLHWGENIVIELFYECSAGYFFIREDRYHCEFCSNTDMLIAINRKYICHECLQTALARRYMMRIRSNT